MKKILTFDCYGTLLDTSSLYDLIGNIAKTNNLSSIETIHIFSSYEDRLMYGEPFISYEQLIKNVLSYCDMELKTSLFSNYYDAIMKAHQEFPVFDDVMPCLTSLKDKGYELALMSNTTNPLMKYHLLKMNNIFDYVLTSDETKCYKPNLEFFRLAEIKFDLINKDHTHIAKGYWWDIVPAAKMNWNKIWIDRSHIKAGRNNEKPYTIIPNLTKLTLL